MNTYATIARNLSKPIPLSLKEHQMITNLVDYLGKFGITREVLMSTKKDTITNLMVVIHTFVMSADQIINFKEKK
jgi:hypothetical protein